MNVLGKLTRQQYIQFIHDYYHGWWGSIGMVAAFHKAFTQVDDPLLDTYTTDEEILDHIERHYVVPEQLAA